MFIPGTAPGATPSDVQQHDPALTPEQNRTKQLAADAARQAAARALIEAGRRATEGINRHD